MSNFEHCYHVGHDNDDKCVIRWPVVMDEILSFTPRAQGGSRTINQGV